MVVNITRVRDPRASDSICLQTLLSLSCIRMSFRRTAEVAGDAVVQFVRDKQAAVTIRYDGGGAVKLWLIWRGLRECRIDEETIMDSVGASNGRKEFFSCL